MADCGGQRTLVFTSKNGFHEKASLVKVSVMTKAPTIQDGTPLPRFYSLTLSLHFGGSVHDEFRPGLRRCNLKCGLSLKRVGSSSVSTKARAVRRWYAS
jgi:hypothetical protein